MAVLALIFGSVTFLDAQQTSATTSIPPGSFQPTVKVLADESHSYALYLPAKYSAQKRWPVLLAFDPSGEGANPVKLLQPAAEKYGFIVVGSNNSRNFVDPSTAIRLLWHDVTMRFAIDPRRVYTTGFSGGSRVASGVAIGCKNCIAGVIACGAGLPVGVNVPPAETTDWFLTTGTVDFNHSEIIRLADALDARHAATNIAFFAGPHSWMSPTVAEEALAWMHLRAMIKGTVPVDKDFVESEFTRRTAAAKSLEQSGDTLSAFRAYSRIMNDFRTLRDVKEIQTMHDALAASNELKRARKSEQATFDLEDRTSASINNISNAIIEKQKPAVVLYKELESLADGIRQDQKTTHDSARRDALARAMYGAFAYARETGSDDMLKQDYLTARDLFRAAAIIRPQAAGPHYLVALVAAHLGEGKAALEELNKSVDRGLSDPQLLENPDFDKLRGEDAFKKLSVQVTRNATEKQAN
jgi:hypothetical protein